MLPQPKTTTPRAPPYSVTRLIRRLDSVWRRKTILLVAAGATSWTAYKSVTPCVGTVAAVTRRELVKHAPNVMPQRIGRERSGGRSVAALGRGRRHQRKATMIGQMVPRARPPPVNGRTGRQQYVPQFRQSGRQQKQTPYRNRLTGGLVQQGLSVAEAFMSARSSVARQINAIRWASNSVTLCSMNTYKLWEVK